MERKILIPKGMLKAACNTGWPSKWEEVEAILEAALRWLSENPIVPTDEQMDASPKEYEFGKTYWQMQRDFVAWWQRRMFLVPEPTELELVKDLLVSVRGLSISELDKRILEAYRRGQRSKEKTP